MRWWALGAMVLAVFAVTLDVTVLTVALPTLAGALKASESQLQWFVTAYTLALVAGIVGAPKESFWNGSIALVAVGLLLAVEVPDLRLRVLGRTDLGLLGLWFGSALVWAAVWAIEPPAAGPLAPVVTLAWSSSFYGLVALWCLFVRRLLLPGQDPAGITIS